MSDKLSAFGTKVLLGQAPIAEPAIASIILAHLQAGVPVNTFRFTASPRLLSANQLLTPNQYDIETDTTGFFPIGSTLLTRSSDTYTHGTHSLKAYVPAANVANGFHLGNGAGEGTRIPATPLTVYILSFTNQASATVGAPTVQMTWYDAGGSVISTGTFGGLISPNSGAPIAQLSTILTSPAGTASAKLSFTDLAPLRGALDANVYFDEIHLSSGTLADAFAPGDYVRVAGIADEDAYNRDGIVSAVGAGYVDVLFPLALDLDGLADADGPGTLTLIDTFAEVASLMDIAGVDIAQKMADATTHDSPEAHEEVVATIVGTGEVSFDVVYDAADPSHIALVDASADRRYHNWKIVPPGASLRQHYRFRGFVTGFGEKASVQGLDAAGIKIKPTGVVTLAGAPNA